MSVGARGSCRRVLPHALAAKRRITPVKSIGHAEGGCGRGDAPPGATRSRSSVLPNPSERVTDAPPAWKRTGYTRDQAERQLVRMGPTCSMCSTISYTYTYTYTYT